jgi:urease accessory protein
VLTLAATTRQAAGTAFLKFTRDGLDTRLVRSFATSPLKVLATKAGRTACWVYTATLGGGIVGGDVIRVTTQIGEGARALLTTQASTKVYRSLKPAAQHLAADVDSGGLLAVVPDPVVCFAGADFAQSQRYELHGDASLLVVDSITSGRHEAGERWAFARYENKMAINHDGHPIFRDACVLEDGLAAVRDRMRGFELLTTAVLVGPLLRDTAQKILDTVSHAAIVPRSDLIVSAAPIAGGGVLLRMASVSVEQGTSALRRHLSSLSQLLGDDPWSRKW